MKQFYILLTLGDNTCRGVYSSQKEMNKGARASKKKHPSEKLFYQRWNVNDNDKPVETNWVWKRK